MTEIKIIAALLRDVQTTHGLVFNIRAYRNTLKRAHDRFSSEGLSFLTKTLPRLAKAFDKALAGGIPLNAEKLGWKAMPDSELPIFMGEFFSRVLRKDGTLLPNPCSSSVAVLRQLLYLFYKYEVAYTEDQEQIVVDKFVKTEDDIRLNQPVMQEIATLVSEHCATQRRPLRDLPQGSTRRTVVEVAREAKILLAKLFAFFDPKDIYPRHGPGAVATKQQLWEKFQWTNVSAKITSYYAFDEFFCSSMGAVCDRYSGFAEITDMDLPARVILVPKDSRGPRLISCEPVDYQWVQQGLGAAISRLVEGHDLTRDHISFTDQSRNQIGALYGSETGRYATLDLNEASDRVSVDLVRLLFPEHVYTYLMACRSSSTVLPNGRTLPLNKFAPMGSCLCFPVLSLVVWAVLSAGAPDAYTRDRILVFGDDVIVTAAYAADAIEHLESFGLKINRDKSCTSGLFRESCGMDAFQGVKVTPIRLRTVWSSTRSPDVYTSWISYANSFYDKRYFAVYDCIVDELVRCYGQIPGEDLQLQVPCLRETPLHARPIRRRWQPDFQQVQYYVYTVKSPVLDKVIDGWSMLLRYFSERANGRNQSLPSDRTHVSVPLPIEEAPLKLSVSTYTKRRSSLLVRRWR